MTTGLGFRPISSAILCTALCLCTSVYGQDTSNTKGSGRSADEYPDLIELDPFGGVSLWGQASKGLGEKLANGGTAGGRVAVNFSRHIGLELGYNFNVNNTRLVTPIAPGLPSFIFGNQIHELALNPVFNLTPRGSRVQPYLTAGVGIIWFEPTKQARQYASLPAVNAIYQSASLGSSREIALNYGGGVKFHLSQHFGLRFDARGIWSRNATFDLNGFNTGGIYIPGAQHFNGFEGTMGLVIYLGQGARPAAQAPPLVVPPLSAGTITGAEGTLCQGKPMTLHSTASDPAGHTLNYAWRVNGSPSGPNSADFAFTPNNAGDFHIDVTVTDSTNPSRTVTGGPITISVKEYVEPQITNVSATPNALSCAADATGTHTSSLVGEATGSACGGNLTYKWTVSEGSVSNDTSPNATFDSSTLNFEGGAQGQTKTVTATLTVTDETGKSVSKTTDIGIKCPPQFQRLSDVVFSKNNARINNCGKRILIDEAAPKLSSGDYSILLVGHRDTDERANAPATGRGRRATPGHVLDEQRVLNAAAVLSGGGGTCAKIDPSRIKVDWVGTDQTSTPDPGLCGASNRASQKERKGSQTTMADKNRRVEVYLVPSNSQTMPPAAKNVKPLPEREVRALGCPR